MSGNCRSRIYEQTLQLSCSKYLPVPDNGTQIPTGELRDTAGSLFDFSTARPVRAAALGLDGDGTGRAGLDHCYVVDGALDAVTGQCLYDPAAQRGAASVQQSIAEQRYLRHVATLVDPASGRKLTLHATQPGVQVYSGNWLDNTNLTDDADQSAHAKFPHIMHNGICLETQHFPDAVNQAPSNAFFPSAVLRPEGEPYFHQAVFTFGVEPASA
jgi:aldose 1-epimerase